jgi:hypothetical protein
MDKKKVDYSELNKALEKKFLESRREWKDKVIAVVKQLQQIDLDATKHTQIHMDMLILREDLVFEIASYKNKVSYLNSSLKREKKTKYHNYATNFDLKLATYYDKDIYISGDLNEHIRQIEIFDNYVYFLKEQIMTCDKMGFSIKHIVDSNRM